MYRKIMLVASVCTCYCVFMSVTTHASPQTGTVSEAQGPIYTVVTITFQSRTGHIFFTVFKQQYPLATTVKARHGP